MRTRRKREVDPDARAESAISTLRGEGKGLFNVYKRRSSHPEDEGVHFEYQEGETRNAQGPSMASLSIWHPPNEGELVSRILIRSSYHVPNAKFKLLER